jgi:prepilin peptidase CpaA
VPYEDFKALLDLLAWLFFDWRTGVLILLLVAAAVSDYRTRRIPNWLVFSGALYGVVYNTVLPSTPHDTILLPLLGLALGLLLFIPLYILRAMGAGDVKLLAMVGAFLGPGDTFYAALSTMMVGGALALLFVVVKGKARVMFRNLAEAFNLSFLSVTSGQAPSLYVEPSASAGKLPYGVAIAVGTIGYLILHQLNFV